MATQRDLERMLSDESEQPMALPLSLLKQITNGFSDNLLIGRGGFGRVYKGILEEDRTVAVKRLDYSHKRLKEFVREAECLMKVKHKNVVRFLGYCADTQDDMQTYHGRFVTAEVYERLFCFEYVPKGTLHDYIIGLEWRQCYQIIKGICDGVHYLHQNRIAHLDLKPSNILLDDSMVPKITDFGISRCFCENQSRAIITNPIGSKGYMAPELKSGKITLKSDIYSLGAIIKDIVTRKEGCAFTVKNVIKIWRNRLEKSKEHLQLEQLKVCAKIGIKCIDADPAKRPVTQLIIGSLAERKITSQEPEGMNRAAGVGGTSKDDADPTSIGDVKLHLSWKVSSDDEYDSDGFLSDDSYGKPIRIGTSPAWFASNISVTSMQTLHLGGCGEWRMLPSLEWLPLLTKLKLSGLPKVQEVSVPKLEELVLIKMPKLERCSCSSMKDLNSTLKVLKIKGCHSLKVFDLFVNSHNFGSQQKPWLPRLSELIIHNCPHFLLSHPLPSSNTVSKVSMRGVSIYPMIEGSSYKSLSIGDGEDYSDELFVLDFKILAFHNLRFLTDLLIEGCRNLISISFEGLRQLVSLNKLQIKNCPRLSVLDDPPEHIHEDLTTSNCNALPSLEYLHIDSSGTEWGWLSLMLQGAPVLKKLDISLCASLASLHLHYCTALEMLRVMDCQLLGEIEGLQKLQSLKNMYVHNSSVLKSLHLCSCTSLKVLSIQNCTSLSTVDGFESLRSLSRLTICKLPGLWPCLDRLSGQQGYKLCPQLETLEIDDFNVLTTSFCKQLTSLQRLSINGSKGRRVKEEQESQLLLLSSLQELQLFNLPYLVDLPAGLHTHPSLNSLAIWDCPRISKLPKKGLPPSLEKLETGRCSNELNDHCRMLATSKLMVQTDKKSVICYPWLVRHMSLSTEPIIYS